MTRIDSKGVFQSLKFRKLDPWELLRLPFRLCNPPPAVGKVRSCGVTPVFKVRLDDVLNRKHLPPLGLKDFEEWLLYVEQDPSGLYFLLWLREYETRYHAWKASLGRPVATRTRLTPLQASSHLSMFFAKARETFFKPNATFELDVPSDLLAPFHMSNHTPFHPDPSVVFVEIQAYVRKSLEDSLRRFVEAQYSNVGGGRMLCGIIAGFVFTLVGAFLPLFYNMYMERSRLHRLTALPGLIIGLTVLFASLNGVCLGVYVFGDLRQLKRFELSRPRISTPVTQSVMASTMISSPSSPHPPYHFPPQSPSRLRSATPSETYSQATPDGSARCNSVATSVCTEDDEYLESSENGGDIANKIYVSPAYYEKEDPELPMQSTEVKKPQQGHAFTPSATFIRPFRERSDDDVDYMQEHPQELQPLSAFDFEALPPCRPPKYKYGVLTSEESGDPNQEKVLTIDPESRSLPEGHRYAFRTILAKLQEKCSVRRFKVILRRADSTDTTSPAGTPPSSLSAHMRKVNAVPAFATPFVRVLSPVIVRAQFEIVSRSALLALLASCVLLGSLLAVPVVGNHRF